jgi:hypothetical protein
MLFAVGILERDFQTLLPIQMCLQHQAFIDASGTKRKLHKVPKFILDPRGNWYHSSKRRQAWPKF